MLERLAGWPRRRRRPQAGIELLFTVCEEVGLPGANAFDVARLRSASATSSTTPRRSASSVVASPTHYRIVAEFHGPPPTPACGPRRAAPRSLAAARAIAEMPLGRIDAETTANVGMIEGGTAINVVPERCRDRGRGAQPRRRPRGAA